jgi:hypothetical protein
MLREDGLKSFRYEISRSDVSDDLYCGGCVCLRTLNEFSKCCKELGGHRLRCWR